MGLSPAKARRILATAERVCSAAALTRAVRRLAAEITASVGRSFPLVLCVMRGSVIFAGRLLPQLRFPLELDYLEVTRYGKATRGGAIRWRVPPGAGVRGRVVLVLDDILDEGATLAAIRARILAAGAARCYSAVLVEKETETPKAARADFVGLRVPDRYVFGFGMDVYGLWRNLPEIYALKK